MKTLTISTAHKTQMIDITSEVRETVIMSGIKEGICTVFTPHTTGSVILFENVDPSLQRDLLGAMSKMAPHYGGYSHAGDNAAAHLKSARLGASVTIPVAEGQPLFGQWQGVFFIEFDGPREARNVHIKIIAG